MFEVKFCECRKRDLEGICIVIFDVVQLILVQDGVEVLSVLCVVNLVGVNWGMVYQYFFVKEDLIQVIMD